MASDQLTLHEVFLVEAYEESIKLLEKRIEKLVAIREDPDYKGAICKRYASAYLNKSFDDEWSYYDHEQYLIKLFRGAITEALEVHEQKAV
jgi:hypothetical protein